MADGVDIDREVTADVWMRAVATDGAPQQLAKSASVPVRCDTVYSFTCIHRYFNVVVYHNKVIPQVEDCIACRR